MNDIRKKGNKTDRTIFMEKHISKHFRNKYHIHLCHEEMIDGVIPDFSAYLVWKNTKEIADVIIVEVKQDIQDFYSKNGKNFIGSSNYIAVPTELVGFAIKFLRKNKYYYVGVLEVCKSGYVREVIYPQFNIDTKLFNHHGAITFLFGCPHLQNT